MKKAIILLLALFFTSTCIIAQTKAGKIDTAKHAAFYTCPNHPGVVQHQPGKCPKCGMALHLSDKEQMKANVAKIYTCPIHQDVMKHDPGKCPRCGRKLNLSPKEQMKAEAAKRYTCPMHPDVALDKEGQCPKCGMNLIEKKQ